MVKLYRIPGTDVKIRISQDADFWVRIGFERNGALVPYLLNPRGGESLEMIHALGFPTEPSQPIDGGDLEEVTE